MALLRTKAESSVMSVVRATKTALAEANEKFKVFAEDKKELLDKLDELIRKDVTLALRRSLFLCFEILNLMTYGYVMSFQFESFHVLVLLRNVYHILSYRITPALDNWRRKKTPSRFATTITFSIS